MLVGEYCSRCAHDPLIWGINSIDSFLQLSHQSQETCSSKRPAKRLVAKTSL